VVTFDEICILGFRIMVLGSYGVSFAYFAIGSICALICRNPQWQSSATTTPKGESLSQD
jgi:bacteriorhodopsin